MVWTVAGWSGKCLDSLRKLPESLVWKVSGQPGNFMESIMYSSKSAFVVFKVFVLSF